VSEDRGRGFIGKPNHLAAVMSGEKPVFTDRVNETAS
jgi:hypothetical protein